MESSGSIPPLQAPPAGSQLAEPTLSDLEPDAFAVVCSHLRHQEVAALAASCLALRHAVACNDRLWAGLYSRQFPLPWQRLTQQAQIRARGSGGGVPPGGWRDVFLRRHDACQQLSSTDPACREWTTDATPVHLTAIHGSGPQRLTLAAQGSTVELRCAAPATKSFQLYGHTARVSCAAVLRAGSGGSALHRLGAVTGSHDQTVRLWVANADPESYEFGAQSLALLTPLRTLRGHQESVTSLQLVSGSTGVTIAATGGKDRVVRLWGLAPLVPSPVQKPQIATLRGHGAPVTCLATCGSSAGSWEWEGSGHGGSDSGAGGGGGGSLLLLSGSLDARVKSWDPWTAACTGTAKLAGPVTAMAPAVAASVLQPHTLLVCAGGAVHLLDARTMRAAGAAALPAAAELHCFAQHGWDLALGGSDGARVFDLRMLADGGASSSGAGGSGARGAPERLRLAEGRSRPVTVLHLDRLKAVTATNRFVEAPLRVWSTCTGERIAELGSCLPAAEPAEGGASSSAASGEHGGQGGGAAAEGQRERQEEDEEPPAGHHARQYQRQWEGVTSLACRGALLVSGNAGGTVCERDYSRGGLPDAALEEREHGGGGGGGKFWAFPDA
ncbi:hypothetical protein ABPG75_003157 [Micractinium tetrahymenae]